MAILIFFFSPLSLTEYQRTLSVEKIKSDQIKKMKLRALEMKNTTIEDLTYAIVKYRMLGLDFIKGNTGPTSLQVNFTQIDSRDPQRIFSFCIQVSMDDDEYQVDSCTPPLSSQVIIQLVDQLNKHSVSSTSSSSNVEAMAEFLRGMRRAFKQQYVSTSSSST